MFVLQHRVRAALVVSLGCTLPCAVPGLALAKWDPRKDGEMIVHAAGTDRVSFNGPLSGGGSVDDTYYDRWAVTATYNLQGDPESGSLSAQGDMKYVETQPYGDPPPPEENCTATMRPKRVKKSVAESYAANAAYGADDDIYVQHIPRDIVSSETVKLDGNTQDNVCDQPGPRNAMNGWIYQKWTVSQPAILTFAKSRRSYEHNYRFVNISRGWAPTFASKPSSVPDPDVVAKVDSRARVTVDYRPPEDK